MDRRQFPTRPSTQNPFPVDRRQFPTRPSTQDPFPMDRRQFPARPSVQAPNAQAHKMNLLRISSYHAPEIADFSKK